MTRIGVEQPGSASLQLRSCPSCGRHAWTRDGREVARDEVLAALRVRRDPPRRPAPPARPAPAVDDEAARRAELQRLLGGFTVHGSTS